MPEQCDNRSLAPDETQTRRGTIFQHKTFQFPDKQCRECPLRNKCIQEKTKFRTILVHQEEALLQQARQTQKTDEFRQDYRKRVVVEHRLARLVHLGIRKARYFGSMKVLFQLAMAATVVNLTWFCGICPFIGSFTLGLGVDNR